MPDLYIQRHHCKDLIASLPSVSRQINCQLFFGDDKPAAHGKAWLPSGWTPPHTHTADVIHRSLLRAFEQYTPHKGVSNLSFYDRRAISFLKKNSHLILVADSDKGLGDVLVTRAWADAMSTQLLQESCTKIDDHDHFTRTKHAQLVFLDAVDNASRAHAVSSGQCRYVLSKVGSLNTGTFRFRPKLHKDPVSARPVFNLNGSWIKPLGKFLCDILAPLQNLCQHVLVSTDQLLSTITTLVVPAGFCISTYDVENLYPSIVQSHLLSVLTSAIRRFYHPNSALASFAITVLQIVLSNQVVSYQNELYLVVHGIATGLQSGVFMANCYLNGLDLHVMGKCPHILLLARFVDDVIIVHDGRYHNEIQSALASWHPSIKCSRSSSGVKDVPFLDVAISVEDDGRFSYKLFRKPLALYHYVPRSSCHPEQVFKSVVHGELHRIRNRCTYVSDFDKEVAFFRSKLIVRGYPSCLVSKALQRMHSKRPPHNNDKKILFKVKHSSAVNFPYVVKHLRACSNLLSANSRIMLSHSMQKSVFRLLYKSSWLAGRST